MANETVYTALNHPTDVLSAATIPAIVESVVVLNLIYKEDLAPNTTVKYFQKNGYLTAGTDQSEGANYTTQSQYDNDMVSVTAAKSNVCSWVSVEALQFGSVSNQMLADEQGKALARKLDDKIQVLFSSFNNSVIAGSVLTVDDCLDAVYTVQKNSLNAVSNKLKCVLGLKGYTSIKKEVIKSGASVFTVPAMISLLGSDVVPANGYVGELPGLDFYVVTSGLPTTGGDDVQLVFDGAQAFAGTYAARPESMVIPVGKGNPSFGYEVSSYIFNGVAIWRNEAGCILRSDS